MAWAKSESDQQRGWSKTKLESDYRTLGLVTVALRELIISKATWMKLAKFLPHLKVICQEQQKLCFCNVIERLCKMVSLILQNIALCCMVLPYNCKTTLLLVVGTSIIRLSLPFDDHVYHLSDRQSMHIIMGYNGIFFAMFHTKNISRMLLCPDQIIKSILTPG